MSWFNVTEKNVPVKSVHLAVICLLSCTEHFLTDSVEIINVQQLLVSHLGSLSPPWVRITAEASPPFSKWPVIWPTCTAVLLTAALFYRVAFIELCLLHKNTAGCELHLQNILYKQHGKVTVQFKLLLNVSSTRWGIDHLLFSKATADR